MTLVSGDDRPRMPRVGPKVFADVPSQKEVTELKRSRGAMFVFAVLVIGLLIAALVALGFLYTQNQQATAANEELTAQVAELTSDKQKLDDELNSYDEYRGIMDLRAQADRLRAEIKTETERYREYAPPTAGPITRIARSDNGYHSAQGLNRSAWDSIAPQITANIQSETTQLRRDLEAAQGWTPPRPSRTPGQITPRTIED